MTNSAVPLHLGGHCIKSGGGTIKKFFRRFAPDGYVPHHFHIRSGALDCYYYVTRSEKLLES